MKANTGRNIMKTASYHLHLKGFPSFIVGGDRGVAGGGLESGNLGVKRGGKPMGGRKERVVSGIPKEWEAIKERARTQRKMYSKWEVQTPQSSYQLSPLYCCIELEN